MLAEDFRPNRIEAAKAVAQEFIDGRSNDRIGLVVFSGESFTQCPLTLDHRVLKNLLLQVRTGIIEDGTAIGLGLAQGVNRLKETAAKSRVMVLLTDGVNNRGEIDPVTAAQIAQSFGVRVYTVGVGTIGQVPYPAQTPFGIVRQMVPVEVDEKTLQTIASMTNPDSGMVGADYPSITYGLRGLAAFEVKVYGPSGDLHSGLYGGAVHNPAVALAELIAGMHDADGRITLPDYYDDVRELSEMERNEMSRLPTDEAHYLEMTGAPALWGEKGFSPAERVGARPTLEVNGMVSGYTGPGFKTVLPAEASAKISMRLVPDQDPVRVADQLRRYFEGKAPKTIRWELDYKQGSPASISDINNPGVVALGKAIETVWGKKAILKREGGSVSVVSLMQRLLAVESVCTGFGLPDV